MRGWGVVVRMSMVFIFTLAIVMFAANFTGRMTQKGGFDIVPQGHVIVLSNRSVLFSNPGYSGLEFTVRFDDMISNHASWQVGGFAGHDSSPVESDDPRAVFYVDVGVMKAFARDPGGGIEWCKPIERNWTEKHTLGIVSARGETHFFVDGVEECALEKPVQGVHNLPVILSEKDKIQGLSLCVSDVRLL